MISIAKGCAIIWHSAHSTFRCGGHYSNDKKVREGSTHDIQDESNIKAAGSDDHRSFDDISDPLMLIVVGQSAEEVVIPPVDEE